MLELSSESFLFVGMKTTVTRKKKERSLHCRYEDLSYEEKEGEKSSLPL